MRLLVLSRSMADGHPRLASGLRRLLSVRIAAWRAQVAGPLGGGPRMTQPGHPVGRPECGVLARCQRGSSPQ